uniref:Uncharacterized protein n=1 Tax=Astyanax mexicanus TaxID=7994 RepID=A0A8B9LL68_ASTMX
PLPWLHVILIYIYIYIYICYMLYVNKNKTIQTVHSAIIGTRLHFAVALSCLGMAFYLVFLK